MLFAIPPTIIILSNFGIKFLIMLILEEILDPPIIQVIGFLILDVTFLKHQSLNSSVNQQYDGKNFVILHTDA